MTSFRRTAPKPHRKRAPWRRTHAPAAGAASAAPRPAAIVVQLYRAVWHFAAGTRRGYVLALLLLAGATGIKLLIPVLAGAAINSVQVSGAAGLGHAGWLVLGVVSVQALGWLLHGPGRVLERNVGLQVRARAADAIYARLTELPLQWHETHHSGELQQRAQQATRALFDFTQSQYLYLQNTVSLVGPILALTLLSPFVGACALTGYVLLGYITVRFERTLMQLASRENDAERRYAAGMLDFLGNAATVISLRLGPSSRRFLDARLHRLFAPLGRGIVVNEVKWCSVDLIGAALCWGLVAIFCWRARASGALLVGGIFMVYQYAQQASGVIISVAANFQSFARVCTDMASADVIWAAQARLPTAAAVPVDWQRIEAHGLVFRHTRGSGGISSASFELRRGERVALVGRSGSGKTTLLRAIAGLYEPEHGYYSVDGEMLISTRHLNGAATLIGQETEIFEASVLENLALGAPVEAGSLARALHVSAFDSVLAALPQGLDTPLSERGFNLSGGQRQRLALARGLLAADGHRACSLLLLDEPTSALDPVTEASFFQRLRESYGDLTVMASVHRLSLLDRFDRIILMDAGSVLDMGTCGQLVARQPLFRELLASGERAPNPLDSGGSRARTLAARALSDLTC